MRAKIVLRVEGAGIQGNSLDEDIARDLGVNRQTVGYWRREFAAGGVERLTKDAPRPGRPRKLIQDSQRLIIETAKAELGSKGKPSSSRALAKLLQDKGISVSHTSVNQIVRRAAIKPARSNEL